MALGAINNDDINSELGFEERWGLKIDEIYKLALQFYKEKNGGKALVLSYNDRLKLLALTKQVTHGKYDPSLVPDSGLFDVIGNNRRHVWESLGDTTKSSAMIQFINIINSVCPLFASVVEAHKIEKDEKERQVKAELEEMKMIAKAKQEEELAKQQEFLQKQVAQELLIRNALNQQTYNQFLSYAQLQHPNNKSQQEALICQLQEQHFQQYMQQVYSQHCHDAQSHHHNQKLSETCDSSNVFFSHSNILPCNGSIPDGHDSSTLHALDTEEKEHKTENISDSPIFIKNKITDQPTNIEAASEWTRKDIKSFKESLKVENEAVIKVGSGELVTIRVPTHQNGTSLFWEFATDDLDIGFGLSFEWSDQEIKPDGLCKSEEKRDVIIPMARTQSHVEVQCGSHKYPGSGIYLLMFDNSYSLWRSKSIYYRVFYSQ